MTENVRRYARICYECEYTANYSQCLTYHFVWALVTHHRRALRLPAPHFHRLRPMSGFCGTKIPIQHDFLVAFSAQTHLSRSNLHRPHIANGFHRTIWGHYASDYCSLALFGAASDYAPNISNAALGVRIFLGFKCARNCRFLLALLLVFVVFEYGQDKKPHRNNSDFRLTWYLKNVPLKRFATSSVHINGSLHAAL